MLSYKMVVARGRRKRSHMSGALLENFTVSEIMKSCRNAGKEPYLIYRDRDAREIDVIIEGDGKSA